ncbi:orexin/Hypocretin receptor type 1-like [Hetaerina americana]|uniref:orexin/Hypocretin receptor type 1-like n=1 Tax=Hetaerina americana TaxID=62018 RepID=UPI003A7F58B7
METVSVAVSVLTLTFISVDRWYAICFPLKFKSTTGRAKTAILVIWFVALCFDIPELVVLKAQPKELRIETILLTQCMPSWSVTSEMTFTVAKSILLYTVPLIFMSFTYYQIVRVLWKSANIPGHTEARAAAAAVAASSASSASHGASRHTTSSVGGTVLMTNTNVSTEGQLRSRRKAAKMLVAVVLMFAVCYFPVHLLGIMRYMVKLPQTDEWVALSMISHWLCYANSAVNPVIYNFMSGKFRREFKHAFLYGPCCRDSDASSSSQYHYSNSQYQRNIANQRSYHRNHQLHLQNHP